MPMLRPGAPRTIALMIVCGVPALAFIVAGSITDRAWLALLAAAPTTAMIGLGWCYHPMRGSRAAPAGLWHITACLAPAGELVLDPACCRRRVWRWWHLRPAPAVFAFPGPPTPAQITNNLPPDRREGPMVWVAPEHVPARVWMRWTDQAIAVCVPIPATRTS